MKTTPNRKVPVDVSEKRVFAGLRINAAGEHPSVVVLYSRTYMIDGLVLEALESEVVAVRDLAHLVGGNPAVVQGLFAMAVNTAAPLFNEIKRLVSLRK